MKSLVNVFAITLMTVLLAAASSSLAGTSNGTAKGGATDLVNANPPSAANAVVAQAVKHSLVQACPNCRTTWTTTTVGQSKRSLAQTLPVEQHLCGDCKTSVKTTGHGKDKQNVAMHTCAAMTGNTASCCAK